MTADQLAKMRVPIVFSAALLSSALAYPASSEYQASSFSYLGQPGNATFDYVRIPAKESDVNLTCPGDRWWRYRWLDRRGEISRRF